jgi:hypothetical protein
LTVFLEYFVCRADGNDAPLIKQNGLAAKLLDQ